MRPAVNADVEEATKGSPERYGRTAIQIEQEYIWAQDSNSPVGPLAKL